MRSLHPIRQNKNGLSRLHSRWNDANPATQTHTRCGSTLVMTSVELAVLSLAVAVILMAMTFIFNIYSVPLNSQTHSHDRPILRICALNDGHHLWAQRGLKEISIIDLDTGFVTDFLHGKDSSFNDVQLSDDGRTCLVAVNDQELNIFRNHQLQIVDSKANDLSSLYALSASGCFAVRVVDQTRVQIWEFSESETRQYEHTLPEPAERITLDPTGERMPVITPTGTCSLYETRTGEQTASRFPFPSNSLPSANPVFTRDGSSIVIAYGGSLLFYDLTRSKIAWVSRLDGDAIGFQYLAVSPDGRWIAASGIFAGIYIFDRVTGQIQCQVNEVESSNRIAFSSSSEHLYYGLSNGAIKVFSISEQREINRLPDRL
jgi:WD40 repeat protein